MSVTAHIYAPYPTHIQLCTNIYRHLFSFPPLSLDRWQFCGSLIKQRTFVNSSKAASKRATSYPRIQTCITCCIPTIRIQYILLLKLVALLFLLLHIHKHIHINTNTYTFSKSKRQTACEHTRWSIFGNFMILYTIHHRVSFILFLHCCYFCDYFHQT